MLINEFCIRMRRPDDGHVHFRQGDAFAELVRLFAEIYGIVVDMPNTNPPIRVGSDIWARQTQFTTVVGSTCPWFRPRFCAYVTSETDHNTVDDVMDAGGDGFKSYFVSDDQQSGTTNAHWGMRISDWLGPRMDYAFGRMVERRAICRVHCENPNFPKGEREKRFLPILAEVMRRHPGLRVVFEHISSAEGVSFVPQYPTMMATVAGHHILCTWQDGYGDHDYCCMPAIKTEFDRLAVENFAIHSAQAAFGSDSAPHPREAKAQVKGANGIFAPPRVVIPAILERFEKRGHLEAAEAFFSERYAKWLGVPLNAGGIEIIRESWVVPELIAGFRPFLAGQTLNLQIAA